MSYGELKENRNLLLTKRGKAHLILIFSTNTNRESVAYRSFNFTSFKLEVSEKLPQG